MELCTNECALFSQSMVDQSEENTVFGEQYTKEVHAILGVGNEHLYPDILRLVLADLMHYGNDLPGKY